MKPVSLAVVGAGVMGRRQAELIAADGACSLVGICDVDAGRGALADELNVPFYGDLDEMLEREGPEGAVISTPNGDHAAGVEACAGRSVDVLIEKPIADTVEGSDRIIDLARKTGIRVLVGRHRRHSPFIQEAHSGIRRNKMEVDSTQIAEFDERGYLFFPSLLESDEVAVLRRTCPLWARAEAGVALLSEPGF